MGYLKRKRSPLKGKKRKTVNGGNTPCVLTRAMTATRRLNGRKVSGTGLSDGRLPTLEELECDYIQKVLRHVSDNKTKAAQILGINRVSLWRKIKSMGLPSPALYSEDF